MLLAVRELNCSRASLTVACRVAWDACRVVWEFSRVAFLCELSKEFFDSRGAFSGEV